MTTTPEQKRGGKGDQPAAVHEEEAQGEGREPRSFRVQRHKHGDLGELGQARVERDLAALNRPSVLVSSRVT